MSFTVDKQTLEDLNIFGKRGKNSIFSLFNRTYTRGGADVLERMFLYPLSDAQQINKRVNIIRYFQQNSVAFPFPPEWFDPVELYLSDYDERTKLRAEEDTMSRKLNSMIGADTQFKSIQQAVIIVGKIFNTLRQFLSNLPEGDGKSIYLETLTGIKPILENADLGKFADQVSKSKPAFAEVAMYDQLIRFQEREKVLQMMQSVFSLDVYIAIATVAKDKGFAFAKANSSSDHSIDLKNVRHPMVPGAVGNDLYIDKNSNIVFLTGANMAGKSTLMKSLGIAVYLAHVGFPVAANEMEFTVRDGLFTTINLSDNLNMGYSHFYAEVVRVKQVSEQLALGKDLFIIFDELFRGTNVKDAYEATVAITKAYARHENCMFVVSTHIIEAADELAEACKNINFIYLPTVMEGNTPRYTYTLRKGVTEDRHGMVIINNEGILEILEEGLKNVKSYEQAVCN
jgi:DNA mismatch repair protein MutS